jgi:hypothetical protein
VEIPDDVRKFVEEAKRRGYNVNKIAIAKVPFQRYYYYEDGEYVGEVGEEIALETNIVMCHDDLCILFYDDEPVLVMVRGGKPQIRDAKEL